jgi:prepilin-type processing-associated H-X9-DG protein/prepilin-type N-terminal cleavage/methylation domain-containing protein
MNSARTTRAFTLVELLVVIGIIASLNKARQAAQSVKCQANLRSIGQGLVMYSQTYDDTLPPSEFVHPTDNGQSTLWHLTLRGFLSNTGPGNYGNQGRITIDFSCPSASIDSPNPVNRIHYGANARLMPRQVWRTDGTSFSYNASHVDRLTGGSTVAAWRPFKFSKIKQSTEKALVADATQRLASDAFRPGEADPHLGNLNTSFSNNNAYVSWTQFVVAVPSQNYMLTAPILRSTNRDGDLQRIRWRHGKQNAANVLFADGHVETKRVIGSDPQPASNTELLYKNFAVTR